MRDLKKSQELRKKNEEKNEKNISLELYKGILDKKKCLGIALRKYRDYIFIALSLGAVYGIE